MQLTLREMNRLRVPLLVWLTASVVAAIAGPFGTLDAMPVGGRFVYWAAIAGGSVALSLYATTLAARFGRLGAWAAWGGFVIVISASVHGVNSLIFHTWGSFADWAYLTMIVGVVTAAVQLVIWAISPRPVPQDAMRPDPFLMRLPLTVRGPLIRIEAQDHYLNVVTTQGNTLILMRLGDAMGELMGRGIQVHRSHWVATDAVTAHRRDKGRDVLTMQDGAEVPVSRSFRAVAQEAGFF